MLKGKKKKTPLYYNTQKTKLDKTISRKHQKLKDSCKIIHNKYSRKKKTKIHCI